MQQMPLGIQGMQMQGMQMQGMQMQPCAQDMQQMQPGAPGLQHMPQRAQGMQQIQPGAQGMQQPVQQSHQPSAELDTPFAADTITFTQPWSRKPTKKAAAASKPVKAEQTPPPVPAHAQVAKVDTGFAQQPPAQQPANMNVESKLAATATVTPSNALLGSMGTTSLLLDINGIDNAIDGGAGMSRLSDLLPGQGDPELQAAVDQLYGNGTHVAL